jgi:GNAT superfamily N-acetyltransferase
MITATTVTRCCRAVGSRRCVRVARRVDILTLTFAGSDGKSGSVLVLRRASPSDALAITRIYVDSWNVGFGHLMGVRELTADLVDRWRRDLGRGDLTWIVAELDGEPVGFVGIGASRDPTDPEVGEVNTIAVDPPSWRRGVGRALMGEALTELQQRFRSAILWTVASYDQGHDFYRATGWRLLEKSRAGGTQVAFGHPLP